MNTRNDAAYSRSALRASTSTSEDSQTWSASAGGGGGPSVEADRCGTFVAQALFALDLLNAAHWHLEQRRLVAGPVRIETGAEVAASEQRALRVPRRPAGVRR